MQCEICEKGIDRGKRIKLEGSIVVVCGDCSRYGEVVEEVKSYKPKPKVIEKAEIKKPEFNLEIGEGLVEGYSELIKRKRESLGMKQEELARKINEPTSVIHRIESGKFEPSPQVSRKIQSALGIKLLERSEMGELQTLNGEFPKELTLGDLVIVKKRQRK